MWVLRCVAHLVGCTVISRCAWHLSRNKKWSIAKSTSPIAVKRAVCLVTSSSDNLSHTPRRFGMPSPKTWRTHLVLLSSECHWEKKGDPPVWRVCVSSYSMLPTIISCRPRRHWYDLTSSPMTEWEWNDILVYKLRFRNIVRRCISWVDVLVINYRLRTEPEAGIRSSFYCSSLCCPHFFRGTVAQRDRRSIEG